MISIRFSLLRELFSRNDIFFYWRNAPGGEEKAELKLRPDIAIEPFTMFICSGVLWSMGAFSYSQSNLPAETIVGRYCSFAHAVNVFNSEHPTDWISSSPFAYDPGSSPIFGKALEKAGIAHTFKAWPHDDKRAAAIRVGHDVWVGQNVLLKRGISIGDGAVVAAGSVVTRDVEPFTIVGGAPARLIRQRFTDAIIRRIMALAWWRYNFTDFRELNPTRPQTFLDELERRIDAGSLRPYEPETVTIHTVKRHIEMQAGQG